MAKPKVPSSTKPPPKARPSSRHKKELPAPSLQWPVALKVKCPTCHRKEGQRCLMSGSGKESPRPHRERMKAGQEWMQQRQAEKDAGSVAPTPEDANAGAIRLSESSSGKSSFVAGLVGEPTLVIDGVSAAQEYLKSEALERLEREDDVIKGIKLGQRLMGDRAFYLRVAELLEKEQANQTKAAGS